MSYSFRSVAADVGALLIFLAVMILSTGTPGIVVFIALCSLLGLWALASAICALARRRTGGRPQPDFYLKLTGRMILFFFLSGTVIFALIFLQTASDEIITDNVHSFEINSWEIVFRSMLASLDLFMLDVDSNLLDKIDHHAGLKGLIVAQGMLSFLCTVALLVNLIFTRWLAFLRLRFLTRVTPSRNHLYIFFGLNDNGRLLARSIRAADSRAIVIFVDRANLDVEETDSIGSIVGLFSHRRVAFDYAEEIPALVAVASRAPGSLDAEALDACGGDVMAEIGLARLGALVRSLQKVPEPELHVFFLGDDEDANVSDVIALLKDGSIRGAAGSGVAHRIYCHARSNGANRVVEDLALSHDINVEIVDSSHLAVDILKMNPDFHPVEAVRPAVDDADLAAAPLQALVVGFGEVGRDAFRFIYEFGTFVSRSRGPAGRLVETPPVITAVDPRMDVLSGAFMAAVPAVGFSTDAADCRREIHAPLLLDMDCRKPEFFEDVLSEEVCRRLNYVVLATGDDDLNLRLAMLVFERIRGFRDSMDHLRIMVRCCTDGKRELMQTTADYLNSNAATPGRVVGVFGNPSEIYTYSLIVKEYLRRSGRRFFDRYTALKKKDDTWDSRRDFLTDRRVVASGERDFPDMDRLRSLKRKESQDMANSMHAATKLRLLRRALGPEFDAGEFRKRLFDADGCPVVAGSHASYHYVNLDARENGVMLRLAMLEHARWNAAHRLLGYVPEREAHSTDERRRRHNCLRPWDELDEEASATGYDYKALDFSVVDTSVSLFL